MNFPYEPALYLLAVYQRIPIAWCDIETQEEGEGWVTLEQWRYV